MPYLSEWQALALPLPEEAERAALSILPEDCYFFYAVIFLPFFIFFPEITDLSFLSSSSFVKYSSCFFISSHDFSSFLILIIPNSPFNFFPFKTHFKLPLFIILFGSVLFSSFDS